MPRSNLKVVGWVIRIKDEREEWTSLTTGGTHVTVKLYRSHGLADAVARRLGLDPYVMHPCYIPINSSEEG